MTKIQQWVAIAAVVIVAVLAAGWFFVVTPQRSKAHALQVQATSQRSSTAGLRTQVGMLQEQAKQLPAKQAELAKFGKQIPNNAALPPLIRSLTIAAASAGVDLVSIAPSVPAPLVTAVPAPAAPVAPAPGKPATTTLTTAPATAPAGVQSIVLLLKLNGTYPQLEQFLANLEGLQRVFLVNGVTIGPSAGSASTTSSSSSGCPNACQLDLDVTGQVFTMPTIAAPAAPIAK